MTDYSSELLAHYEGLARSYTQPDFAVGYDEHRPSPPTALIDALCVEAQVERPARVVDLGSGTGLSTRVWAERADEVIGVEASDEMRARAEQATGAENVRYVHAFAQKTGLEEASADLVTASQSFHWMDATTTLAEIARILRPGGVFAAYDYDWPPVCSWEVEAAFTEMVRRVGMLRPLEGQPRHTKDLHLERMRDSGHFRFVREIVLHSRERGNAARIIGMALSLGPLVVLLDRGMTEDELGLAQLRETATRALGTEDSEWFISYRTRLGVK